VSTLRLTRGALADIRRIVRRSKAEFGPSAEARYKLLLDQALQDLAEDPHRVGVKPIPDVRPRYFVYHITFSKLNVTGRAVGRPRHIFVFSIDGPQSVLIVAVVHEREMLERHLND
jgi:plasmid stabilization system protein ParE